jgi:carbon-monoxide dehydrogenase medium subunit
MKPVKFDYHAPVALDEALDLLGQYGDDAKVLAGGQSLMPMMNMRLVRPKVVIDINRIANLSHISPRRDGSLAVGAMTRQREVEKSALVSETVPLLASAIPYIGHFQIRNRGTVGGSLAHSDPAAEIPAVCLTLDAEFDLASTGNERTVKANDFFLNQLCTALEPVELLTQVRIPHFRQPWQFGFQEVCRRDGDFALVGAIAMIQIDDSGVCQGARITTFGAEGKPMRMDSAEQYLSGASVNAGDREEAARLVSNALDPISDIHASSQYRKDVAGVMVRRALEQAMAGAQGESAA